MHTHICIHMYVYVCIYIYTVPHIFPHEHGALDVIRHICYLLCVIDLSRKQFECDESQPLFRSMGRSMVSAASRMVARS